MSDINNCTFTGRLGRDPEIKYMADGKPIANFSIANGRKWGGEETTTWIRLVAFGKQAEIIAQYMTKGSQIGVVARFQERKWKDKEGNDRYTAEFVVNDFQFLGGKGGNQGQQSRPRTQETRQPAQQSDEPPPIDYEDDDIPFS